jgi:hypothetical protein
MSSSYNSTLSNSVLTFMNNRCLRGSRKDKNGVCVRNSARARARDEKAAFRQLRAIHSRKRCLNGSRKNSKGVCIRNSARARAATEREFRKMRKQYQL